jgi:hypothetical protein
LNFELQFCILLFSFCIFNFCCLLPPIAISERARPDLPHFLHELLDHVGESLAFGGRKPLQPESFLFQTQEIEQLLCYFELLRSPVIAKGVMAIADVSPGPHHAVRAFFERPENVPRADPAGTHHPDQPDVGRILHPTHTGCVRSCVRAPITGEDDDTGIEIFGAFLHIAFSM